ncbi:Ras GTPase-activating domain-containing protein [Vairimorpha necatrix]|uniref:Ras GTPase-activating domain-containing protein n=1 Tax=Vairimorpha necatrix TaxID=6039 RepID=A0AAX4JEP5_9MICR
MVNSHNQEVQNIINVHQRLGTDIPITSDQMDTARLNTRTYDYLCRLEEAKTWISSFTPVPDSFSLFEEEMRKGFFLVEVLRHFSPESVGHIFVDDILQYRHTDNINYFLDGLKKIGLPRWFYFEVIDLYEKKNFPKVVYCVHALAHFLKRRGISLGIIKREGQVFEEEDYVRMDSELENIKIPQFENIPEKMELNNTNNTNTNNTSIDNTDTSIDLDLEEDLEDIKAKIRDELLNNQDELLIDNNIRNDEELDDSLKIKLKVKAFLFKKSFNDIFYLEDPSVFSIRHFLFLFFKNSSEIYKESFIDELHKKISDKLRDLYNKEIYLEDIENRIRLMIHNKLDLYNIPTQSDYYNIKPIQDILQIIQTSPEILRELLNRVEDKENFICTVILPLYSNVSGIKEEYLFLQLLMSNNKTNKVCCINQEDKNRSHSLSSHMTSSHMTSSHMTSSHLTSSHMTSSHLTSPHSLSSLLLVNYFRVSQESVLFRDGLFKIIRNLESLEIECNPTEIHRHLYGVVKTLDESLENKRVSEIYETRLKTMRGILTSIFDFIHQNINSVPYIIRHYYQENDTHNFMIDLLFPYLYAPDLFNDQNKISESTRQKIYKIINLITHFIIKDEQEMMPDMTVYLPIKDYLVDLSEKYKEIIRDLIQVQSTEQYFQLETLNELARVQKSVIYLPLRVVNGLIILIKENKDILLSHSYIYNNDTNRDETYNINDDTNNDNIYNNNISNNNIYNNNIYNNNIDLIDSLELLPDNNCNKIICFSFINSDWVHKEDRDDELENFIKITKRKLIYLIKISKGRNILDLIYSDPTEEEKILFNKEDLLEENIQDLKDSVHSDLKYLETRGIVSSGNLYSEILNLLAQDIVGLKLKSTERSKEIKINQNTYNNLLIKEEYLDKKVKEYDEYIEAYCSRLACQNKNNNNKEIIRLNKQSKYGSYKYEANEMIKMNVLLTFHNTTSTTTSSDNALKDIYFIFMSNKPLVFKLEIYINDLMICNPYEFRFEDVLGMKKDKIKSFNVLDICSLNTEGLIKLLNEKYIKQ